MTSTCAIHGWIRAADPLRHCVGVSLGLCGCTLGIPTWVGVPLGISGLVHVCTKNVNFGLKTRMFFGFLGISLILGLKTSNLPSFFDVFRSRPRLTRAKLTQLGPN